MTTAEATTLAATATMPEVAPICDRCHLPKVERVSRFRANYWTCPPCNQRKDRDRYAQHKAVIEAEMLVPIRICACGKRMTPYGRDSWTCNPCRVKRDAAAKAEAAQNKASKITGACWEEKRDYWRAWRKLRLRTLPARERTT